MDRGTRLRSSVLLGFDGSTINNHSNNSNPYAMSDSRYTKPKPWNKSRLLSMLCVVWLIFTVCLAIMMIVTLVQPQWIGRNMSGAKASFGLYRTCSWTRTGDCEGSLLDFNDIPSSAWRAASILVLLSVIICFIAIVVWATFWLCFVDRAYSGFRVSSILVFVAGLFFLLTCIIYPNGFDAAEVRQICSDDADSYKLGDCKIMWVYWLAIICTLDAFILACFAWLIVVKDDKILQPKRKVEQNESQLVEMNTRSIGRSSTTI